MRRMELGILLIVLSGAAVCSAQQARDADGEKKIAALIDQLAAKAERPPVESQKVVNEGKVWAAADALHKLGVRAFPQLIEHFDDERFCFSQDSLSESKTHQQSVGQLCRQIVSIQVDMRIGWRGVRDPRGTPGAGSSLVPHEIEAVQAWWERNQHKQLWELQVDSIRSVVELNRKRLESETDAENLRMCREAIQANEDLIAKLTKEEKPEPTKPFRPYIGR